MNASKHGFKGRKLHKEGYPQKVTAELDENWLSLLSV